MRDSIVPFSRSLLFFLLFPPFSSPLYSLSFPPSLLQPSLPLHGPSLSMKQLPFRPIDSSTPPVCFSSRSTISTTIPTLFGRSASFRSFFVTFLFPPSFLFLRIAFICRFDSFGSLSCPSRLLPLSFDRFSKSFSPWRLLRSHFESFPAIRLVIGSFLSPLSAFLHWCVSAKAVLLGKSGYFRSQKRFICFEPLRTNITV